MVKAVRLPRRHCPGVAASVSANSSGGVAHEENATEDEQHRGKQPNHEPGLLPAESLELCCQSGVGEPLVSSARYELGKPTPAYAVQIPGPRAARRFICTGMPIGELLGEFAPTANRAAHQDQRPEEPGESNQGNDLLQPYVRPTVLLLSGAARRQVVCTNNGQCQKATGSPTPRCGHVCLQQLVRRRAYRLVIR